MKTLLILLTLVTASFTSTGQSQWHVANKIDLEGALYKDMAFIDSKIYYSTPKELSLVALNPVTGAELFRSAGTAPAAAKRWESAQLLPRKGSLLQIYSAGNELFLRDTDLTGKELSTRKITLENRGEADNFILRDSLLIFTYRVHGAGNYQKERTVMVRYDLTSGKILSRKNSPVVNNKMARFSKNIALTDELILMPFTTTKNGMGLFAFDINSGELKWKYFPDTPGHYYHYSLLNKSTIILNDLKDKVILLDVATGDVRKTKATGETKPVNRISPHLLNSSEILIGYYRLTKYNTKMAETAKCPQEFELREGLLELNSAVAGRDYNSVILFNKDDLTVQKQIASPVGFEFDGKPIENGEGLFVVNARVNAGTSISELWHIKKSGIGYVDLTKLDPSSSLYSEGKYIASGGTVAALPERDYRFHILGGNCVPYSFRSRVTAGDTRSLPQEAYSRTALPKVQKDDYKSNHLDDLGVSFTALLAKTPDTLWYQLAVERGNKLLCNGVIVADASAQGLTAIRIDTKEKLWNYNNSELQMMFNFDSTESTRKSYFEHVTTLAEENLIIGRVTSPEASYLMGMDVSTGKLKWVNPQYGPKLLGSYDQLGMQRYSHQYQGLLWGKTANTIYAIDARTGDFVYKNQAAQKGNASILGNLEFHGDTLVYFYSYGDDKYLQWINIYNQKPLIKTKVPAAGQIVPIPESDHIYFVTAKQISEYDEKGKLLRSAQLPPVINQSDFVFDDKRVYICSNYASKVHALDRKNLKHLWTYTGTGKALDPDPKYAAKGEVVISSQDRKIRILDGATGKVKKTIDAKGFSDFNYWKSGEKTYFMERDEIRIYDF